MQMMWHTEQEKLSGQEGVKVRLFQEKRPFTFLEVLNGWRTDMAFRTFFLAELTAVATTAIFWEMPPITRSTLTRPYEFVAVHSPYLATVAANNHPFAAQLAAVKGSVITFANLGGDATLVVPRAVTASIDYAHLATFLQNAPQSQKEALLRTLGEAVLAVAAERPLWISTSGLGVYWLHIRLDSRPKYYTHIPYREAIL